MWNKVLSPGKNKEDVYSAGLPAEGKTVLKSHPAEQEWVIWLNGVSCMSFQ